ncbi:unnamed protein product [Lactuca virosa]|uniref:Splicing factor RBM39 linker domain-containing protein n=1 Tax=Lactuca virosa TaxID=75947 RepID=A0AAU9N766_9ASTR|nr:unnamed protein product [Lactuca virosa]
MAKLDRSGITTGIPRALGAPIVNGSGPTQVMNVAAATIPVLPPQFVSEPIGNPNECLLLKNMFDPAAESDPEFDLDIKEDVGEECSDYARVKHIYVDKGKIVILLIGKVLAASRTQQAMHKRWFARRLISAIFLGLIIRSSGAGHTFIKDHNLNVLLNKLITGVRALIFFQKRIQLRRMVPFPFSWHVIHLKSSFAG